MQNIHFITSNRDDIIISAQYESDLSELRNINSDKNYAKQADLNEVLVYKVPSIWL